VRLSHWLEGETNDVGNNKLIIRRFTEELINTASATRTAELIAPNAALYVPGMPEPLREPAGFLSIVEMMRDMLGILRQIGAVPTP
jgi:hypothetical protein